MKYIALILAILITVPPVLNAVGYLMDNESIVLDENFGEEEKEERESKDGEEKDKELNLDDFNLFETIHLDKTNLLDRYDDLMPSQHDTENISPPPKV